MSATTKPRQLPKRVLLARTVLGGYTIATSRHGQHRYKEVNKHPQIEQGIFPGAPKVCVKIETKH